MQLSIWCICARVSASWARAEARSSAGEQGAASPASTLLRPPAAAGLRAGVPPLLATVAGGPVAAGPDAAPGAGQGHSGAHPMKPSAIRARATGPGWLRAASSASSAGEAAALVALPFRGVCAGEAAQHAGRSRRGALRASMDDGAARRGLVACPLQCGWSGARAGGAGRGGLAPGGFHLGLACGAARRDEAPRSCEPCPPCRCVCSAATTRVICACTAATSARAAAVSARAFSAPARHAPVLRNSFMRSTT